LDAMDGGKVVVLDFAKLEEVFTAFGRIVDQQVDGDVAE